MTQTLTQLTQSATQLTQTLSQMTQNPTQLTQNGTQLTPRKCSILLQIGNKERRAIFDDEILYFSPKICVNTYILFNASIYE